MARTKKQEDTAVKKTNLALAILKYPQSLSKALKEAGIPRSTYYHWKKEDPDFCKQLDNLDQLKLDLAEDALWQKIQEGDTKCILFYLERKGGYGKKSEVETTHKHLGVIQMPKSISEKEFTSIRLGLSPVC